MTRAWAVLAALAVAGCATAPRPQVCQCACVQPVSLPPPAGCVELPGGGRWCEPAGNLALPADGALTGPASTTVERLPPTTADPCNGTDLAGWSEPVAGGGQVWHPCVTPW